MSKEHWDNSFSDKDYVYGEEPNEFIKEMSTRISEHTKVACFAEGEGRNAIYIAKQGHDVTAFDQSIVGLNKTKALAEKNGVFVETVERDLTKDKVIKEQFDAAILVFGHVPKQDQEFFIKNVMESVKPGGLVMFEVYSEAQIDYNTGGPGAMDRLYNPQDILRWISDYKCLHFYYGEAERHEGKRHSGKCHVVQVVVEIEDIPGN